MPAKWLQKWDNGCKTGPGITLEGPCVAYKSTTRVVGQVHRGLRVRSDDQGPWAGLVGCVPQCADPTLPWIPGAEVETALDQMLERLVSWTKC